ncbi:transcription termination factor MTERF2 [Citrus sinensis]|uniref:Transcription termination factor MTERF2 n=1 Tax=Citrus sinensis TaxID=2711 RepID=A0ACB8IGH0_CITSI|nr:transcription termination factor MTERF2 [Citrus sinensis]
MLTAPSPSPCPHSPLFSLRRTTTISAVIHHHPQDRQHNAKSASLLRYHFTNTQQQQQQQQKQDDAVVDVVIPPEEKVKLLELSLVRKRPPQFPGSIYDMSSGSLSHPPHLRTLFKQQPPSSNDNDGGDVDEELIMKALDIRRQVTAEIFKEAMWRKGKFGITYSTNVADRLPDFIDHVMIKAAALKKLPEFADSSFNVRAKWFIEDSNVVPLIRWLKHNGLSYPKIAKLICMSGGNLESIRHLAEWLKSVHVKGEFLGVALLKTGGNILERSIEELNEIVEYLETNGVRRDWMGYVMSRCPQLLSQSIEEVKTRVHFYLDMGMNKNDFGTMVFKYPKILGFLTLEEMNQKVTYLKEFGLSTEDVGRLLAFRPHLMGCGIGERWKPLVKYLYYLGVSRDGMRRMLVIKPMVFCFDLETTIVPKVIFLMTKAGVSERDIGKCLALGPELLGCSIGNKLEVNVKYFLSLGIKLHQLGAMIADFPMLLRYNIDIFRPKYRYLRRTMVRPLQDLIEFPRFFSYSLEERIIPRHKIMVENRVNFKLRYMLACSDEEFNQKVADKVEGRRLYELGLINEAPPHSQTVDDSLRQQDAVDYTDIGSKASEPQAIDSSIERTEFDRSSN